MKILLSCVFATLTPLSLMADKAPSSPVQVSIDVPNPAWSLKIAEVYKKAGKLLIVCEAQKKEGMAIMMMTKAKDTIQLSSELAALPREVYVKGQTWNYNAGYTPVNAKELEEILKGATKVYSAKKKLTESSFLGLAVKEAHALAKKHNLPSRVVEIDGKPQATTMDMRPERFNFAIKEGKVVRVTKG